MSKTALEKAQKKFEQARAALDAVKSREAATLRKKDTRRKIVLGGALLELSKLDKQASALVSRIVAGLTREHDKVLFEKAEELDAKTEAPKIKVASGSRRAAAKSEPLVAPPSSIETSTEAPMVSPPQQTPGDAPTLFGRDARSI